jgi:ABC-2 type transport system permease protein
MAWQRTAAIALRQLYLIRGSPARVLPLFLYVVVDICSWGFLTRYLDSVASAPVRFLPVLLGAVLLWDFLSRVMQGVTMAFFEDVWSRNFVNVFATPICSFEYLLGLGLCAVATSMIGLVSMLAVARFVFGLPLSVYGPSLVGFVLVLFAFGSALGILGCSLVLRYGPASEWFVWPIPAFLAPFSGVVYPISTLPAWMQPVSSILPSTYVFEGLRAVAAGAPAPRAALAIGAALSLLYVALAFATFRMVYRHAVRTGLIARYSAETVS